MEIMSIKPCSSGFGEYECGEKSEITELDVEVMEQEGWERTSELDGLIHYQPSEIWKLEDDVVGKIYCGIQY